MVLFRKTRRCKVDEPEIQIRICYFLPNGHASPLAPPCPSSPQISSEMDSCSIQEREYKGTGEVLFDCIAQALAHMIRKHPCSRCVCGGGHHDTQTPL